MNAAARPNFLPPKDGTLPSGWGLHLQGINPQQLTPIVFQKFSCTRLEGELRVRRTGSYVVEQFDR